MYGGADGLPFASDRARRNTSTHKTASAAIKSAVSVQNSAGMLRRKSTLSAWTATRIKIFMSMARNTDPVIASLLFITTRPASGVSFMPSSVIETFHLFCIST